MKTLTTLSLLFIFAACEVVIVEPFDPRDRVTGSYNVLEYSDTYGIETQFPIRISKAGNDGESIRISNFYDVGINVRAFVRGDRVIIPFQVVDGYEISGDATLYGNEIDFTYTVYDRVYGGFTDLCFATAW